MSIKLYIIILFTFIVSNKESNSNLNLDNCTSCRFVEGKLNPKPLSCPTCYNSGYPWRIRKYFGKNDFSNVSETDLKKLARFIYRTALSSEKSGYYYGDCNSLRKAMMVSISNEIYYKLKNDNKAFKEKNIFFRQLDVLHNKRYPLSGFSNLELETMTFSPVSNPSETCKKLADKMK